MEKAEFVATIEAIESRECIYKEGLILMRVRADKPTVTDGGVEFKLRPMPETDAQDARDRVYDVGSSWDGLWCGPSLSWLSSPNVGWMLFLEPGLVREVSEAMDRGIEFNLVVRKLNKLLMESGNPFRVSPALGEQDDGIDG